MSSLRAVLIVVLCFAGAALAQTPPTNSVAIFKNISGQVVVLRDGAAVTPRVGSELFRTDSVRSGPDGSAGIVFTDGTRVAIGASTEVAIRQYVFEPGEGKYDFDVYLTKGSAVYASGRLGKLSPEAVRLSTPRATTGVRGTRFILKEE